MPTLRLLYVGGQQLEPFCHNDLQRAVLALPGRNVIIVRAAMQEYQVRSHRPSYINALLIASRGVEQVYPCQHCVRSAIWYGGWPRPFPLCIKLRGHFGGSCANCKWPDRAASCSIRDEGSPGGDDEDGLPDLPAAAGSGSMDDPINLASEPGSADDPIDLASEPGSEADPIVLD